MSATQPDEPAPPPDWGEAFAAICHTHRGRLVRWLTAIFGPRDAEDIAQEALTRLYARPGLLGDEADAWPWLSVVARNVGRDLARHNAFATAVDAHDLADLPDETRVWDQVSARDDADRLVRALTRLTSQDRALVRLRDVQGLSISAIAELTGGNENATRQQLFRARRKLQNAYVALGGDRPLGTVALLGLRVREFVRRHAPVFDMLSGSAASVLAAALPAVAGATMAGMLLAIAQPGSPAAGAAGTLAASADRETPHGVTATARRASPELARTTARRAPAPSVFTTHRHADPVDVSVNVYDKPFSGEAGTHSDAGIWIKDPLGGTIYVEYEEWQDTPGHGPVCNAGVVQCG